MKPDAVLLNDMDEAEVAPSEMFSRLGMLVVESRVPHLSAKGRSEGPHCPPSPWDLPPHHTCRPHSSPLCKRAEALRHQMHVLWKNHIPMCIEVLLYEDCAHGAEKAAAVDVAMPSSADNYVLLEQWTVQIVPRRGVEGAVRPRELFQAIKSYLHFSQLSAWLNLTRGKTPRNVGYRISPPGEFCISAFRETPQWHTFPVCALSGNAAGVRVTMGCLPRRHDNQLLVVPCHQHHPLPSAPPAEEGPLEYPGAAGARGAAAGTGALGAGNRSTLSPLVVKPPDALYRDVPQFVSPQRPRASMVPPRQHHVQQYLMEQQQMQMQGYRVNQQQQPSVKSTMPSGPADYTPGQWPAEHGKRFEKRRSIQEVPRGHRQQSHAAPSMQQSKAMRIKKKSDAASTTTPLKKYSLQDAYHMQKDYHKTTLEELRAQEAVVAATATALVADQSPTPDEEALDLLKQTGAIPKKKFTRQASPASLSLDTHSAPGLDIFHPDLGLGVPKSPKVLFSKKSPGQGYYHKDDGRWRLNAASCSDSADSDQSSPEIDKYLKNMKQPSADPLSPEDIQNYLASLSIRNRKRQPSPLAKTPSPDSIDPASTAVKDLTTIFSSFGEETLQQALSKSVSSATSDNAISAKTRVQISEAKSPKTEETNEAQPKLKSPSQVRSQSPALKICSSKSQQVLYRRRDSGDMSDALGSPNKAKDFMKSKGQEMKVKEVATVKEEEEKVLFRLGDDDNEAGNDDDDVITSGVEARTAEYTNGVCQADPDSSSPNNVDADVTNGYHHVSNGHHHQAEDDVAETSPSRRLGDAVSSVTTPSCGGSALKRSVSDSESLRRHLVDATAPPALPGINKASPLYRTLMREMNIINKENEAVTTCSSRPIPTSQERALFRKNLQNSTNMIFHASTGLPLQSSPAPMKKRPSDSFDYDESLRNPRAIKNSLSCVNLDGRNKNEEETGENRDGRFYSTSAPASTNCLLGNFEESLLNGRLEPSGVVDGFSVEIGASGAFCPKHVTLPVTAFFFNLSDDNAPSPYLGHVNLEMLGRRGYHIPKKGTVQVTLFNPNKTVVKMFVVVYDLTDMPAQCGTFLRQRTLYMPASAARGVKPEDVAQPVYIRYLIHLRFQSSKSSKIYLHTDMRMIFARDKFEYDSRVANYELRSFTEAPTNPKFSPKR